jgi:hypothetical protein
MSHRTDPMFYEFDVRENKTGKVNRARIFCWWSGDHSIAERKQMCDCQLAGFFNTPLESYQTWEHYRQYGPSNNGIHGRQSEYLKHHSCNHKPSRKYTVTAAYLPGGDVIDLEEQAAA